MAPDPCPELSDRDWIIEQKRAGLHNPDIARKLGVTVSAVQTACKRLNITLPLVFVHNPELKALMQEKTLTWNPPFFSSTSPIFSWRKRGENRGGEITGGHEECRRHTSPRSRRHHRGTGSSGLHLLVSIRTYSKQNSSADSDSTADKRESSEHNAEAELNGICRHCQLRRRNQDDNQGIFWCCLWSTNSRAFFRMQNRRYSMVGVEYSRMDMK